jgi:uncharacterized membrane protein YcgQ (UPF0703/DUF1980 family)
MKMNKNNKTVMTLGAVRFAIFRLIVLLVSVSLLLSACDDNASGNVKDVRGEDAQRNSAGTSAVDVSQNGDSTTAAIAADASAEDGTADAQDAFDTPARTDEDPLVVGEKMFVGQMNDIYLNPDDYIGREIRYEGFFTWFENETTGQRYNSVVRNGPGCCGYDSLVGFEVDWKGDAPAKDDWCSVQGVLDTYDEDGMDYIIVRADSLEVLPYRGNDTVTQ